MKKAWRRLWNKYSNDSIKFRKECKICFANSDLANKKYELSFEPEEFLALTNGIESALVRPEWNVKFIIPVDKYEKPTYTDGPGTTVFLELYYFPKLSFKQRLILTWNELLDSWKVKS